MRHTFEQFDIVTIITTLGVRWMVDHPGADPKPDGNWSVVCCFPESGELLLSKDTTTCRIPIANVKKIANYDVVKVFKKIKDIKHGKISH